MAEEASINDFGLLIAYVLPGFVALWGVTYLTDALDPWFVSSPSAGPTIGGFLYVTLASVAAGVTVSTVRWLVVDTIHHKTGVRPPSWDFSLLRESAAAFGIVVDHYYRYYQAYANALVSLVLVFVARRVAMGVSQEPLGLPDLGLLGLMVVFFLGSRDSLKRYYSRGGQLLARQGRRIVAREQRRPKRRRAEASRH